MITTKPSTFVMPQFLQVSAIYAINNNRTDKHVICIY